MWVCFYSDEIPQKVFLVQLQKYETAPYFFYQTKTRHGIVCWFLCFYLNLTEFAWSEPKIILFWCAEQFYVPIRQIQSNFGKNTEINKQSQVKFWFNRKKNMELSHIYLAVFDNVFHICLMRGNDVLPCPQKAIVEIKFLAYFPILSLLNYMYIKNMSNVFHQSRNIPRRTCGFQNLVWTSVYGGQNLPHLVGVGLRCRSKLGVDQSPRHHAHRRAWITKVSKVSKDRFIYILGSSNSSSFTFWSSKKASSSRSNWTGTWTGNSNGSWTDKHSSHFSTAKEMSVKATFFFM